MKAKFLLALVTVAAVLVTLIGNAAAAAKVYTITNNTGGARNDIHLQFSESVTWTGAPNPVAPFTDTTGTSGHTIHMAGGSVAAGAAFTITVSTTGSGPTMRGDSLCYWTLNGNVAGVINDSNSSPFP